MADDPRSGRARSMAEVIAQDAPVAAGRALAIMAAVTRTAAGLGPDRAPRQLTADQVHLHEDGGVSLDPVTVDAGGSPPESELGASIGRLLFALLVGRTPFDRDEAFEPALRSSLPASTCALIARSASEAPGQWPDVEEWSDELARVAGPLAPPVPPTERRRARRRRSVLLAGLALLVVLSVVVVWLAPRWWDAATDEGSLAPADQRSAAVQRPAAVQRLRASS